MLEIMMNPIILWLFTSILLVIAAFCLSKKKNYYLYKSKIDVLVLASLYSTSLIDYQKIFDENYISEFDIFNFNWNGVLSTLTFLFSIFYYLRTSSINKCVDNNKKCDNLNIKNNNKKEI